MLSGPLCLTTGRARRIRDAMSNDVLSQMIEERQSRRAQHLAAAEELAVEIRALIEAREKTSQSDAFRELSAVGDVAPNEGTSDVVRGVRKRTRPLKPVWRRILRYIGRRDKTSLDQIMRYSEQHNLGINRNTLRSQVSIYTSAGWLERVSEGVFRLTEAGAKKCESHTDNEPPDDDSSGGSNGGEAERVSATSTPVRRELLSTAALPIFAGMGSAATLPIPNRNPRSRR